MATSLKQRKFCKWFTIVKWNGLCTTNVYDTDAYLKPSWTSTIKFFRENSDLLLAINWFRKKIPPQGLKNFAKILEKLINFANCLKSCQTTWDLWFYEARKFENTPKMLGIHGEYLAG